MILHRGMYKETQRLWEVSKYKDIPLFKPPKVKVDVWSESVKLTIALDDIKYYLDMLFEAYDRKFRRRLYYPEDNELVDVVTMVQLSFKMNIDLYEFVIRGISYNAINQGVAGLSRKTFSEI